MKQKVRLTSLEALELGFQLREKTKHGNPKYYVTSEQLVSLGRVPKPNKRNFVKTQKKLNKDGAVISTLEKLQSEPIEVPDNFEIIKISTSQTTGQQWIQYAPKQIEITEDSIDFDKIMSKYANPIKLTPITKDTGVFTFDRLVYTDVHIGMTTNKNGHSLYGGKWDEDEIERRLTLMVGHILETKKGNTLIIDELGDFMDGWDGETTRKGHTLPQNMDNEKAFDVGLGFKIKLIDNLAKYYDRIICNNICNDNHAGSFGYVVNSSFKKFIEIRYSNVKVNNMRRFINHYIYGKNCFILTHGKDDKHLKFGFKPVLETKQIEKISNYIKEYKLHDYIIEFSKGDSHQKIFDESTSDEFDYYNYPAFSPSSEWVQTNFKKGMSGFEMFNYKDDGNKVHSPFRFKWNKDRNEVVLDYSI